MNFFFELLKGKNVETERKKIKKTHFVGNQCFTKRQKKRQAFCWKCLFYERSRNHWFSDSSFSDHPPKKKYLSHVLFYLVNWSFHLFQQMQDSFPEKRFFFIKDCNTWQNNLRLVPNLFYWKKPKKLLILTT